MNFLIVVSTGLLVALAGIEGLSYRWTHPRPAPHLKVVMAQLPSTPGRAVSSTRDLTPLPEVYRQSAPKLRCSSGEVFYEKGANGIGLNLAFFEWEGTDTGSVLEAFRHMPEVCLGSVGMKLVSTEKPVRFRVGEQTLVFDHTVFRDPGTDEGLLPGTRHVHSFRGIWVAGMEDADSRRGIDGDSLERLRDIRLKSAAKRFRPPYACVIQGAVRGAFNGEEAWNAFEESMLKGMEFR